MHFIHLLTTCILAATSITAAAVSRSHKPPTLVVTTISTTIYLPEPPVSTIWTTVYAAEPSTPNPVSTTYITYTSILPEKRDVVPTVIAEPTMSGDWFSAFKHSKTKTSSTLPTTATTAAATENNGHIPAWCTSHDGPIAEFCSDFFSSQGATHRSRTQVSTLSTVTVPASSTVTVTAQLSGNLPTVTVPASSTTTVTASAQMTSSDLSTVTVPASSTATVTASALPTTASTRIASMMFPDCPYCK